MNAIENLRNTIQAKHGLAAKHLFSSYIREDFEDETFWDGNAEIFEVDHPDANRCYAWDYETDDGQQRVATVLGVPEINSSRDAVRAYIASGHDAGPTMD